MNQVLNHLSYSSLAEFARCPKGWYAHRCLGKPQISTLAANFGHRFEEAVTAHLGATLCPKRQERQPKPAPVSANPIPAALLVASEETINDDIQAEVMAATRAYLESDGAVAPKEGRQILAQKEIFIEPECWGMLADFHNVHSEIHLPLLGYIDLMLVDSQVKRTIVDLKTSTRAGFQSSWMTQMAIYALAERAQRIEAHLLIRPKPPEPGAEPPKRGGKPKVHRTAFYGINPTPAFFAHVMAWVGAQAEGIRRACDSSLERLPACESWSCAWCSESANCEAKNIAGLIAFGGTEAATEVTDAEA